MFAWIRGRVGVWVRACIFADTSSQSLFFNFVYWNGCVTSNKWHKTGWRRALICEVFFGNLLFTALAPSCFRGKHGRNIVYRNNLVVKIVNYATDLGLGLGLAWKALKISKLCWLDLRMFIQEFVFYQKDIASSVVSYQTMARNTEVANCLQ